MTKFWLLLKKELRELLTPQLIVPFVIIMVILSLVGKTAGKQIASQAAVKDQILVLNHDQGELSKLALTQVGQIANVETATGADDGKIIEEMKQRSILIGLIIPADFSQNALKDVKTTVKTYSILQNFSLAGSKKTATLTNAVSLINQSVSNSLISLNAPDADPLKLKNPVVADDFVSANGKVTAGNALTVLSYISQQTNYVPIVLFIVIVFAAQMIATAVATEKENKTLETLLSLPVSRKVIVTAKMISAGLISLLMAGIYMYGLKGFIGGVSSAVPSAVSSMNDNTANIVKSLGLSLTSAGYLELGIILFLGILLALALAMILGVFSEDAKSAQSVIAPLMVLVMIPYFATLMLDINQLSPLLRGLLYAIPFTHIFLATPNIMLGNHLFILYGSIYLLILFIIFVYIAAKIFSSDLILTMKLNFLKKKN